MANDNRWINLKVIVPVTILALESIHIAAAQVLSSDLNQQQQLQSSNLPPQTSVENLSDPNKVQRKMHRIGTAIPAPQNAVSIKSTDAGHIRRLPPVAGCSNCGIIDFVNKITQGSGLNAIASGVVAGTVAREVLRQSPHVPGHHPHIMNHQGGIIVHPDNQYQVGITMSDGKQAIIALPDASSLQQGDRIQLIDGVIVLDRQ
ncbi:MAG: hypothetical protein E6Q62_04285 [Nitrosomonas sp.]|nr:MAG: hypothetical protein E6Q62_04285 [Nitrosomonas sp.]